MAHYPASFTINRLALDVRLGFYDAERASPQPIAIDVRLYFPSLPDAASNDHGRFIDYAVFSNLLTQAALQGEFRLIEFMAQHLFTLARDFLDGHGASDVALWLKLTKCKPDVAYLQEGASFVLCDLPPEATLVEVA